MHVGMATVFQNPQNARADREVYQQELRLSDFAEALGFESIWGVEHHFTDYTMCPDVLQFLTYMAGRTERAQLGSMVVVLPWHVGLGDDPIGGGEALGIDLFPTRFHFGNDLRMGLLILGREVQVD